VARVLAGAFSLKPQVEAPLNEQQVEVHEAY
jgi:hypothetical protein